jgi:hypothetical protein
MNWGPNSPAPPPNLSATEGSSPLPEGTSWRASLHFKWLLEHFYKVKTHRRIHRIGRRPVGGILRSLLASLAATSADVGAAPPHSHSAPPHLHIPPLLPLHRLLLLLLLIIIIIRFLLPLHPLPLRHLLPHLQTRSCRRLRCRPH